MRKLLEDLLYRTIGISIVAVLGLTTRRVWINKHILETYQDEKQNFILGVWHNSLSYFIYPMRVLRLTVLASKSRDGRNIAAIAGFFRVRSVAGSTSDGALGAMREMYRLLRDGKNVTIMPDGPKGPRYEAHDGIVAMAKRNGVPIIPAAFAGQKMWEFRSWDRMKLPKPFSKVVIYIGDPIWLERKADDESARKMVEQKMRLAVVYADRFAKGDLVDREPLLLQAEQEEAAQRKS